MALRAQLEAAIEEVRREYVPDPRLAVFEVAVVEGGGVLTLAGVVSDGGAATELHRRVAIIAGPLAVRDELERLPGTADGDSPYALVTSAVAPMLAGPLISEAHLSQTLLGHRLIVLRERGRWLHCRSEDGYLGWVHRGYVCRVDPAEAEGWVLGLSRELCFSLGVRVLADDGTVIARLPWGARAVRSSSGLAVLPDGRAGRAVGELIPFAQMPARFPAVGEAVVATALHWTGAPYVWGGTVPSGVDCSGLVQAVFRTHGLPLPRDSDMQAGAGEALRPATDLSDLRPGDLLFFAEEGTRISHVAISMGGSRIVHSSLGNAGVWMNDLAGDLPYERELRRLFVCARRLMRDGS
ncbi:MAG TPA: SH3 domain-containing C40 family peptidase [Longimicrobiaceae bacterium]|nr:SH3 domain-containing C40 family peptidase [Longimicrobiaceae bacterium]